MRARWTLVEYGSPQSLVGKIAYETGLERSRVSDLIVRCGERAGKALGFSNNPILVIGDKVRAVDFAGQLKAGPSIEIEIAPKFLGSDLDNSRWREDFFFLAMLSLHGKLLSLEGLRAKSGAHTDLHSLVARSIVQMYWRNHRRPNRAYRLKLFQSFAIDGDVDPLDIIQPDSNGFSQSNMVFDRYNHHNAVILSAAKVLLPNLRDPSVIAQVERLIQSLSPQKPMRQVARTKTLPTRARRWQALYDLSVDVLRGYGISYLSGTALAPGYVLDTWRVWEDLLSIASRMGFGADRVQTQKTTTLGTRYRMVSGQKRSSTSASVSPDITILSDKNDLQFLIDAKYKGRSGTLLRISEADLYESLAFAAANSCDVVVLAYPAAPRGVAELGRVEVFEHIEVENVHVIGVDIDVRGVSSLGGLVTFSNGIRSGISSAVSQYLQ